MGEPDGVLYGRTKLSIGGTLFLIASLQLWFETVLQCINELAEICNISQALNPIAYFGFLIFHTIIFSLMIPYLLQRVKLCLDFISTCYILHVVYLLFKNSGSLPRICFIELIFCGTISVFLAEYLCYHNEMKTISVEKTRKVVASNENL